MAFLEGLNKQQGGTYRNIVTGGCCVVVGCLERAND